MNNEELLKAIEEEENKFDAFYIMAEQMRTDENSDMLKQYKMERDIAIRTLEWVKSLITKKE